MYFCLIFEAQKGRFDLRLGIFYHNLRFTNLWHLWKLTRNLLNKWSCDLMYNLRPLIFLFSNTFKYLALSIPDEGYSRNLSCTLNLISTFLFKTWLASVKGDRHQSFFFHLLAWKPNLDKFSISSNKIFHNFYLSESSFTCPGLLVSGLAWRLRPLCSLIYHCMKYISLK